MGPISPSRVRLSDQPANVVGGYPYVRSSNPHSMVGVVPSTVRVVPWVGGYPYVRPSDPHCLGPGYPMGTHRWSLYCSLGTRQRPSSFYTYSARLCGEPCTPTVVGVVPRVVGVVPTLYVYVVNHALQRLSWSIAFGNGSTEAKGPRHRRRQWVAAVLQAIGQP